MSNENSIIRIGAFSFDTGKRTFSYIPDNREYMILRNATAMIEINERAYDLDQADAVSWEEKAGIEEARNSLLQVCFTFREPSVSLTANFEIAADGSYLLMDAVIANLSDQVVRLDDCNLILVEGRSDGQLPLSPNKNDTLLLKYKMWNSSVQTISSNQGVHTSDFLNLMHNPTDGLTSMISFITVGKLSTHHETNYAEDSGSIEKYRAWCKFDRYWLAPEQTIGTEKLKVEMTENPFVALENWARLLNEKYRPKLNPKTTVGWLGGAWVDTLSEREQITSAIIEENALAIRDRLAGFDIDYIWMSQVNLKNMLPGNWLEFNDRHFPESFEKTLETLVDLQFLPGLWIAPFWVFDEAEEVAAENEGNFVLNPDGSLNRREIKWEFSDSSLIPGRKNGYYVLDGAKEGSLDFIERVFERYKELGIRYFMVDFLDDGWKHNVNMEPLTALECARGILQRIREAAGEDTHLLSAVGSTPSYIGCFDAARINHDYGEGRSLYPPYHAHYNATYTVNDKFFSNFRSLLNNFTANYFTHRQLYINDNNLLTVDKPLPRNLAEMNATLFGLSGSPVMLGDDIRNLHADRLALIKKILPLTADIAFPMDLFKNTYPDNYSRIITLSIDKPWESYLLVAVFNLDETTYAAELDFAEFKLDAEEAYRVYDFWAEEYIGTYSARYKCEVPPNSCKIYRIARARNHPWLLSTDMHVQQGNVEIEHVEWEEERMILRGSATRPIGETGNLYFIMPKNFRLVNHEKSWLLKDMRDLTVTIRKEIVFDNPTMDWELQFAPLEYVSAWH